MLESEYIELFARVFPNVKTRENYVSRLNGMLKKVKQTGIREILEAPDVWYPRIREAYPALATRKNLLTAILVLFREDAHLSSLEVKARWKKLHEDLGRHADIRVKRSEPEEKQISKYTSYEEIESHYDTLKKSGPHNTLYASLQFLLLSILVHLRPKRADLGAIHLYKTDPNRTDVNYMVLRDEKKGSSFLSLSLYKTSKHYKKVEEELPAELVRDIRTSLQRWPRDFLFVKDADKGGKGAMSNDTYAAFVKRTFEQFFGRATGVSLLRHIYISEKLNFDNMTLEEQEEEARLMLHTSGLQRQYKWPKKTICPKICVDYLEQRKGTRRARRAKQEGGTRRRRLEEAHPPF